MQEGGLAEVEVVSGRLVFGRMRRKTMGSGRRSSGPKGLQVRTIADSLAGFARHGAGHARALCGGDGGLLGTTWRADEGIRTWAIPGGGWAR